MSYNRNDLPYGDGTINETIEVTAPGWHGKAKHLEILPHDPPRQWLPGSIETGLYVRSPLEREPEPMEHVLRYNALRAEIKNKRSFDERHYIGFWFRQHWQKLAKAYGVAVVARRLKKQGIPLHVALMILTGHAATEK